MTLGTTARLVKARELLAHQRVDAFITGNLMNIRYLSGFTGSAGYLVVDHQDASLYVDGRYGEQAASQFKDGRVQTTVRDILAGVIGDLKARLPRRLGFESRALSYEEWRRLADGLDGVELVPTVNLVEGLRARKDTQEIAAIRRAVDITDRAYEDFLTWIKPGMSEFEVAGRCEYYQRGQGAERKETRTAVGSGPRSSMPHCIAAERVIGADEPVMLDIGCLVDGYTSDLTRTVFLGTPPREFETIYRIVGEAQQLAIEAVKPGVQGRAIHEVAREHLARHGYGDYFPHSLGHSLGLNIHERPSFSPTETAIIEAGNVITVEPGIYLPGRFGVRTEDLILVTEAGREVLNHTEHALMVR